MTRADEVSAARSWTGFQIVLFGLEQAGRGHRGREVQVEQSAERLNGTLEEAIETVKGLWSRTLKLGSELGPVARMVGTYL
ncbi:hypothetical protein [Nesterenkonia populi]